MNSAILWFWPFGQALCSLILHKNPDTTITCLDLDATFVTEQIQQNFATFSDRLIPLSSKNPKADEVYAEADLVVIAVWSRFMVPVMESMVKLIKPGAGILNVAKALSPAGKLFSEEFAALGVDYIHYAALAWWMAAQDIMHGNTTWASIACADAWRWAQLQQYFASQWLEVGLTSDVRWVEMAWILKNMVSIHAGYVSIPDNHAPIDLVVQEATQQIQNLADQLNIQTSTFDQSYCRDHPTYGDIKTSCYGGTRNFMLGQLWKKKGSLAEAIAHCNEQNITVEWANTLRALLQDPSHPFNDLPFVGELIGKLKTES